MEEKATHKFTAIKLKQNSNNKQNLPHRVASPGTHTHYFWPSAGPEASVSSGVPLPGLPVSACSGDPGLNGMCLRRAGWWAAPQVAVGRADSGPACCVCWERLHLLHARNESEQQMGRAGRLRALSAFVLIIS